MKDRYVFILFFIVFLYIIYIYYTIGQTTATVVKTNCQGVTIRSDQCRVSLSYEIDGKPYEVDNIEYKGILNEKVRISYSTSNPEKVTILNNLLRT